MFSTQIFTQKGSKQILKHNTTTNLQKYAVGAILIAGLVNGGLAQTFKAIPVGDAGPNTLTAINNSGYVVVNQVTPSSSDVLIWNQLSGDQDLGLAGATGAAINGSGAIVGAAVPSGSHSVEGFLWTTGGGEQWLGSLGGGVSAASAINDSGAVVGSSYTAGDLRHAFFWTQAGGMIDLTPTLTSTGGATATGVNSSGEVVGYYYPAGSSSPVGFYWTQAGGLQNIGTPGTIALGVNDSGVVVGQTQNSHGNRHAFSWTPSGGLKDLGTLGGTSSTAMAVNSSGWIVGTSMITGTGLIHGFLWTPSGGMQDFRTLAGVPASYQPYSVAINDAGVISFSYASGAKVMIPKMTVTVTSSQNPSVVGNPVTFTATISSAAGAPPNGDVVQFIAGGNVIGSGTVNGGIAQFTTSALTAGTHPIIANYTGDGNYLAAKSAPLKQVVNP